MHALILSLEMTAAWKAQDASVCRHWRDRLNEDGGDGKGIAASLGEDGDAVNNIGNLGGDKEVEGGMVSEG